MSRPALVSWKPGELWCLADGERDVFWGKVRVGIRLAARPSHAAFASTVDSYKPIAETYTNRRCHQ